MLTSETLAKLSESPLRFRLPLLADELRSCIVVQDARGNYLFEIPAEGATGAPVGESDREFAAWILLALNSVGSLVDQVNGLEEAAKERDELVAEIDGYYRYTRYVTHAPKPLEGVQRFIETIDELKAEKAELETKVQQLEDENADLQEQIR